MNLDDIIKRCKANESKAQQELYDHYKGILFGICRRYITREDEAEDVFVEGFAKIFNKIGQFADEGSFEGWMKRIMVNESLMFLRANKLKFQSIDAVHLDLRSDDDFSYNLDTEKILALMDELPTGYRTILNMYVVEGYKHKDIADILGISINTSKSQLILAKKRIQEILLKRLNISKEEYGT